MRIVEFLNPQSVIVPLASHTKSAVLRELCEALETAKPGLGVDRLTQVLEEREKLGSTGIGDGVAIPHGKISGVTQLIASFGISKEGIAFDAMDGKLAHLFFALLAPENSAGLHLKALARISRLFKNNPFRETLLSLPDAAHVYQFMTDEDLKS